MPQFELRRRSYLVRRVSSLWKITTASWLVRGIAFTQRFKLPHSQSHRNIDVQEEDVSGDKGVLYEQGNLLFVVAAVAHRRRPQSTGGMRRLGDIPSVAFATCPG